MIRHRVVPRGILVLAFCGASTLAGGQEAEVGGRRLFARAGAGLAGQSDGRGGHLARLGLSAMAGFEWRWTSRAALVGDVGLSSFWEYSNHIHAPCPPEMPECHEPTGALTVASLVAAVTYAEAPHGRPGMYVLAGGGLHRALSHPDDFRAVRPGFTLGLGVAIPRQRFDWRIDLRAHVIGDWAGERWVVAPMTFALTF